MAVHKRYDDGEGKVVEIHTSQWSDWYQVIEFKDGKEVRQDSKYWKEEAEALAKSWMCVEEQKGEEEPYKDNPDEEYTPIPKVHRITMIDKNLSLTVGDNVHYMGSDHRITEISELDEPLPVFGIYAGKKLISKIISNNVQVIYK